MHFCQCSSDFFFATSTKSQQREVKQNLSTLQGGILKKHFAGKTKYVYIAGGKMSITLNLLTLMQSRFGSGFQKPSI
jgi:hypothetical protein